MLRGAIIGFGEVARNGHWPAYALTTDAHIVAVVERSADRRALAESLSPGLRAFATIADLAAAMSVDFVDICTPPALHPQPILEALARGWHVLCEKPFVLDPAVLETVQRRAAAAGLAVVPVHNWKYAPIVLAATAALRDGAIGTLTRVEVETSRLRAAPTAEADGTNWRRDPAMAGGGILMDHGWHSVYLVLHWFNERATSVRATLHHPPIGGVEDEASVVIEFPSGEATINLTWNGTVRRNTMRLVGTGGEIRVDDDTLVIEGSSSCAPAQLEKTTLFPLALSAGSAHDDWFAAMLPHVIACFRNPELSRPLVDEAAACLSIIQQAYGCGVSPQGAAAVTGQRAESNREGLRAKG